MMVGGKWSRNNHVGVRRPPIISEICGIQKDELALLKVTEGKVVSSGVKWVRDHKKIS